MKKEKKYYKISGGILTPVIQLSARGMLYGTAQTFLAIYLLVVIVLALTHVIIDFPYHIAFAPLKSPMIVSLLNITPIILIVIASRLPPTPKVFFHFKNKMVKWSSKKSSIEVPFDNILFETFREPSKSGISSIRVTVSVFGSKPFFPTDPPKKNPNDKYVKPIWLFYCSTQIEADDIIESIRMFMDGKLDGSPSKFDDL